MSDAERELHRKHWEQILSGMTREEIEAELESEARLLEETVKEGHDGQTEGR